MTVYTLSIPSVGSRASLSWHLAPPEAGLAASAPLSGAADAAEWERQIGALLDLLVHADPRPTRLVLLWLTDLPEFPLSAESSPVACAWLSVLARCRSLAAVWGIPLQWQLGSAAARAPLEQWRQLGPVAPLVMDAHVSVPAPLPTDQWTGNLVYPRAWAALWSDPEPIVPSQPVPHLAASGVTLSCPSDAHGPCDIIHAASAPVGGCSLVLLHAVPLSSLTALLVHGTLCGYSSLARACAWLQVRTNWPTDKEDQRETCSARIPRVEMSTNLIVLFCFLFLLVCLLWLQTAQAESSPLLRHLQTTLGRFASDSPLAPAFVFVAVVVTPVANLAAPTAVAEAAAAAAAVAVPVHLQTHAAWGSWLAAGGDPANDAALLGRGLFGAPLPAHSLARLQLVAVSVAAPPSPAGRDKPPPTDALSVWSLAPPVTAPWPASGASVWSASSMPPHFPWANQPGIPAQLVAQLYAEAPLLGQDNAYVWGELLGLTEAEIAAYEASGVIA